VVDTPPAAKCAPSFATAGAVEVEETAVIFPKSTNMESSAATTSAAAMGPGVLTSDTSATLVDPIGAATAAMAVVPTRTAVSAIASVGPVLASELECATAPATSVSPQVRRGVGHEKILTTEVGLPESTAAQRGSPNDRTSVTVADGEENGALRAKHNPWKSRPSCAAEDFALLEKKRIFWHNQLENYGLIGAFSCDCDEDFTSDDEDSADDEEWSDEETTVIEGGSSVAAVSPTHMLRLRAEADDGTPTAAAATATDEDRLEMEKKQFFWEKRLESQRQLRGGVGGGEGSGGQHPILPTSALSNIRVSPQVIREGNRPTFEELKTMCEFDFLDNKPQSFLLPSVASSSDSGGADAGGQSQPPAQTQNSAVPAATPSRSEEADELVKKLSKRWKSLGAAAPPQPLNDSVAAHLKHKVDAPLNAALQYARKPEGKTSALQETVDFLNTYLPQNKRLVLAGADVGSNHAAASSASSAQEDENSGSPSMGVGTGNGSSFGVGDLVKVQHKLQPGSDIGIVQNVHLAGPSGCRTLDVRYILGGVGKNVPSDHCESWDGSMRGQTIHSSGGGGHAVTKSGRFKEDNIKDFALAFAQALHEQRENRSSNSSSAFTANAHNTSTNAIHAASSSGSNDVSSGRSSSSADMADLVEMGRMMASVFEARLGDTGEVDACALLRPSSRGASRSPPVLTNEKRKVNSTVIGAVGNAGAIVVAGTPGTIAEMRDSGSSAASDKETPPLVRQAAQKVPPPSLLFTSATTPPTTETMNDVDVARVGAGLLSGRHPKRGSGGRDSHDVDGVVVKGGTSVAAAAAGAKTATITAIDVSPANKDKATTTAAAVAPPNAGTFLSEEDRAAAAAGGGTGVGAGGDKTPELLLKLNYLGKTLQDQLNAVASKRYQIVTAARKGDTSDEGKMKALWDQNVGCEQTQAKLLVQMQRVRDKTAELEATIRKKPPHTASAVEEGAAALAAMWLRAEGDEIGAAAAEANNWFLNSEGRATMAAPPLVREESTYALTVMATQQADLDQKKGLVDQALIDISLMDRAQLKAVVEATLRRKAELETLAQETTPRSKWNEHSLWKADPAIEAVLEAVELRKAHLDYLDGTGAAGGAEVDNLEDRIRAEETRNAYLKTENKRLEDQMRAEEILRDSLAKDLRREAKSEKRRSQRRKKKIENQRKNILDNVEVYLGDDLAFDDKNELILDVDGDGDSDDEPVAETEGGGSGEGKKKKKRKKKKKKKSSAAGGAATNSGGVAATDLSDPDVGVDGIVQNANIQRHHPKSNLGASNRGIAVSSKSPTLVTTGTESVTRALEAPRGAVLPVYTAIGALCVAPPEQCTHTLTLIDDNEETAHLYAPPPPLSLSPPLTPSLLPFSWSSSRVTVVAPSLLPHCYTPSARAPAFL
jgi:hypothetical protein